MGKSRLLYRSAECAESERVVDYDPEEVDEYVRVEERAFVHRSWRTSRLQRFRWLVERFSVRKVDRLGLQVLLEPLDSQFPSKAALLVSTDRHLGLNEPVVVHPNGARTNRTGNP